MVASTNNITIPADRFLWAIQRNGMDLENYLNSHPKSALEQWMSCEKQPTIKQLEDFAKSVNLPFGYLFLKQIPHETLPFPVFRGEAGKNDHFDLNVYDTVNIIQRRQDWLEDYIEENELDKCEIVGSISKTTPILETVGKLRALLSLEPRWAFGLRNSEVAVNKLTELLECAGFFIAYNGVVGNNTRRPIKVTECRGFALVNKTAPYIFVNSQDAKTAQLFTLIHETAHIMLGVSAGHAETDTLSDDEVERYCDKVAAEFLVPADVLREVWDGQTQTTSHKFKVSELVIARRAHDLGLMSDKDFRAFFVEYKARPKTQVSKSSGGSFYRSSIKRIGLTFAMHIRAAVNNMQLSYTDAYRLTGLYGDTYKTFMGGI